MDSGYFLDKLLSELGDDNIGVCNIGFEDKNLLECLNHFEDDKKIICISSCYFNRNLDVFASFKNINYLESIISLPIYKKDDNLLILIFNSDKPDSNCLFIDESDSLIHRNDSIDWTYAADELIAKIIGTYNDFKETNSSVVLNLNEMFEISTPKKTDYDELLSLKTVPDDISAKKHRVISDEVADGLLSLKQKQSVRDEISKHDIKSVETPQSMHIPFLNDAMYYKKRQNPQNLLYRNNKPLIDGEVQFRKLGKIADLHNIYVKNDKDSILIATCKRCESKLVYHNKDITDFKGEVFIELINVDDSVSIEYLYEYLSSSNGLNELWYFSKGNNFITPEDIKNVKIPIPPLEIQKEIVNVSRESREFFRSVELFKKEFSSNILDYKRMKNSINELKGSIAFDSDTNEITSLPRSWRHVYKGLIWPLAISYLSATKGGFETVEKKDNYLVLFEFIAAFNAIVLISGLPNDVYQSNFSRIWNSRNPKEYNQMTFANWYYLCKNLSEVYESNNFTSQLDEELFDMISDKKILTILEDAKDIRNEESHGSQTNAYEAKEVVEKLDTYLDDIFDILDVYSNYKLIYVTGDVSSEKQAYLHRVILLNGPCAQPIYDEFRFDTVLEKECLYLYNPKNNKKLKLKDSLVKFKPVDKNKKRWALFIYYSCDKNENNAFYRCFQSKENNVKESIYSLRQNILS